MTVFPNADSAKTVQQLRGEGFDKLGKIRDLRNRIAHHEPIFARNLQNDYASIRELVEYRRAEAANWLGKVERVTGLIAIRP